jgi:hypothetical protein
MNQQLCRLRGHAIFMHFEPHRLSLCCAWCGYQTPGWEINGALRAASHRPSGAGNVGVTTSRVSPRSGVRLDWDESSPGYRLLAFDGRARWAPSQASDG